MKIGILTHPLKTNYGGVLQNYALQTVLKKMGHDVITINIGKKFNTLGWIKSLLKYPIKKILNRNAKLPITKRQTLIIEKNINVFINKYINISEPMLGINKSVVEKCGLDVIIVGSDQVWRPDYVRNIGNMFLDFLGDSEIVRIAYAASFGIDNWTYTKKQENICLHEVNKFRSISVREKSGVHLCNKYLKVNATHVLDPTLLLKKEEYVSLIDSNKKIEKNKHKKQLSVYILDYNNEKNDFVNNTATKFDLKIVHLNNHDVKNQSVYYKERIVPPIENWIKGFHEADFIITDSFHGTVFSILFNKPFVAIVNNSRGASRFRSLLEIFDLKNRLVADFNSFDIDHLYKSEIDWLHVNKLLDLEIGKSMQYLQTNLV